MNKKQLEAIRLHEITEKLSAEDASTQLEGLMQLRTSKHHINHNKIYQLVEQLAIHSADEKNQQLALESLTLPVFRKYQKYRFGAHSRVHRRTLIREIYQWQTEGLVSTKLAVVLQQRYAFDIPKSLPRQMPTPAPQKPETKPELKPQVAAPEPAPKVPQQMLRPQTVSIPAKKVESAATKMPVPEIAKPERSLGEILFSETSIKIALYLGAFLFLAAAFIFAGLFEALRIPILSLLMVISLGSAIGLKKWIQLASLVMYIIYSFLIFINGQVIANITGLSGQSLSLYWIGITFVLLLSWAYGAWLYSSRFFSVMTFLAMSAVTLQVGWWLKFNQTVIVSLLLTANLFGLYVVHRLSHWKDETFGYPLFITVQVLQGVFILWSIQSLITLRAGSPWWLLVSLSWVLISVFYIVSDLLRNHSLFPAASVIALIPVVWFATGVSTSENMAAFAAITWGWGVIHAISAEWLRDNANKHLARYSLSLFFTATFLMFVGNWIAMPESGWLAGFLWFATSLLYLTFYLRKAGFIFWAGALFSLVIAYFNVYFTPEIRNSNLAEYILLWPTLFYLGLDGVIYRLKLFSKREYLLSRFMGATLGIISVVSMFAFSLFSAFNADIGFLILGIFLLVYAWAIEKIRLAYFGTGMLALSLGFFSGGVGNWALLFSSLATVYFVGGFILLMLKRYVDWGVVFGLSGAVLMVWTTLGAFVDRQQETAIVIVITLVSLLYFLALELILHHNQDEKFRLELDLTRLGALLIAILNIYISVSYGDSQSGIAAIAFIVLAILFGSYSVLRNTVWLAYASTAAVSLFLAYVLIYFQIEKWWVPVLTALAGGYFLAGVIPLFQKIHDSWIDMFRTSGLVLVSVISWLSIAIEGQITAINLTAISLLLFLAAEVILTRLTEQEEENDTLKFSMLGIVWMSVQVLTLVFTSPYSGYKSMIMLLISIAYLAYAILLNRPETGYAATTTLAISVLYLLDYYEIELWLSVMTGLGLAYLIGGSVPLVQKRNNRWADMLRTSGLLLIVLLSWAALSLNSRPIALNSSVLALALLLLSEGLLNKFEDSLSDKYWQSLFAQVCAGVMSIQIFYLMLEGGINPGHSTLLLVLMGGVYLVYGISMQRHVMGYAATLMWAGATLTLLEYLMIDNAIPAFMILSIAYYGAAYLMFLREKGDAWAEVFRNSVIVLGLLYTAVAPIQDDVSSVFAFALTASFGIAEAYRMQKLWPIIPANFLYLGAYLQGLAVLDVNNPQFYSTGVAAMGLVMHFLLLKMEEKKWALYTGFLSQLILLSITYYQMATTEELSFFVVLFFQALVVFAYGLIMRSRSLVFTPVGFIILGVVTVLYSSLAGYATLIIIGVTGFLLLLGGIGALSMREKMTGIGDYFNNQMEDWRP